MKIIRVSDCSDCPYYEQVLGKKELYHVCHKAGAITRKTYETLLKRCTLEEVN